MENVIVGQLIEVSQNKTWCYGVVVEVFDDMYHIEKEYGGRVMSHDRDKMDQQEINDSLVLNLYTRPLYKDGKPVMSRKNLFGKYTFKPKY